MIYDSVIVGDCIDIQIGHFQGVQGKHRLEKSVFEAAQEEAVIKEEGNDATEFPNQHISNVL